MTLRAACRIALTFVPALGYLAVPPPAAAQGPALPRAHSFEIMAGAIWEAAADLGESDASLTTGGAPLILFKTVPRLRSSTGLDVRLAYNLTSLIALEAGMARLRPELQVRVSGDLEGAPAATISSDAYQLYRFDGTALVHLRGLSGGTRMVPYVGGGAGYTRQLDGSSVLLEDGATYHAGMGVKYFFASRPPGFFRGAGVRAEARWHRVGRELDVVGKNRTMFSATVGGVIGF